MTRPSAVGGGGSAPRPIQRDDADLTARWARRRCQPVDLTGAYHARFGPDRAVHFGTAGQLTWDRGLNCGWEYLLADATVAAVLYSDDGDHFAFTTTLSVGFGL